jgi:hypothetical protein
MTINNLESKKRTISADMMYLTLDATKTATAA